MEMSVGGFVFLCIIGFFIYLGMNSNKKSKSSNLSQQKRRNISQSDNSVSNVVFTNPLSKHYNYAKEKKDDLNYMKKCCDIELDQLKSIKLAPAPYYFERVAILSRKIKDYQQEIHYCESYIKTVEDYFNKYGTKGIADVRMGPRYQAIVKRLPKAKELYKKSRS